MKSKITSSAAVVRGDTTAVRESRSARWVVASLSLSMLLSSLGTSIASVGLPTLATVFSASFQEVQWVVLGYLLAITTLIVTVGRLGDIMGRRRLLLAGLLIFTAASLFCALSNSLWMLIASRAAQGVGAAIMMALTLAFVGDAVPKEQTGSAMGLLGTMSAIGIAMGPTLGGYLIGAFAWPAIFLINIPLGILTLSLAYRFLPADRQRQPSEGTRFDNLGTVLLTLTLAAYALAMTMGGGGFGLLNVALLIAAAIGGGLFVVAERRAVSPLIRLEMFSSPTLRAGFTMSVLVTTVVMTTLAVGPFYLAGALALDATHVGMAMSAGPIVAALTGIPAGRFVDRFGTYPTRVIGLIGMVLGSILMVALPTGFGIAGYVIPLVVITGGYALFQAANNTAVMTSAVESQRGIISGLLNLSRNLGLITGASAMGAVFAFASAAATPDAIATGMRVTFSVAGILVAAALIIAVCSGARAHRAEAR